MHSKTRLHTEISAVRILSVAAIFLMLLVSQCMAVYNFEGIPFKTVSQGEVTGDVLVFGSYGLRDPPITSEFDVTSGIQWARTYVGVWGGTPRYTGWVQVKCNDHTFEKITLYGQDDKTPNVYATGYGVYWVAYDTTSFCRQGHNTVVATTSKGQPESKLDGRIYAVVTVVVTKDPGSGNTKYWIAEGNENLHGEGWSGTNPTSHEDTTVSLAVPDLGGIDSASLTVMYLTSTRGQPDYLTFNGRDLGTVVSGANYPANARDVANERSYDAGQSPVQPFDSRYWDIEVFDVKSLLRTGNNEVRFFRGRDLDGDGVITETGEKPEGEDYLHPVVVLLTLKKSRPAVVGPDLTVQKIEVTNAFEGQDAEVAVTVQNLGATPSVPAGLSVSVDGAPLGNQQVTIEKSGVQQVTVPWKAASGTHTFLAEVTMEGDLDTSNNKASKEVTVGSLPDLSVSVGRPSRPDAAAKPTASPVPVPVFLGGLAIGAALLCISARNRRPPVRPVIAAAVAVTLVSGVFVTGLCALPAVASAGDTASVYLLPVIVKNSGGSDAPAFVVTVYLDGEKITTKSYDNGIAAGKEISADIPLHTVPGSHVIKVVADEAGKVKDANRGNNVVETTYAFP